MKTIFRATVKITPMYNTKNFTTRQAADSWCKAYSGARSTVEELAGSGATMRSSTNPQTGAKAAWRCY